MSNKQIMKDVFDNEFNANKIRNQIFLKSEKKTKKNMIKFLQYATFVFVIAIVGITIFINNQQANYIYSDITSNIIINKINEFDLTKLDADIKFEEIIFLDDINLKENEYIFLKELIQNSKHLIINTDISISILRKIGIEKPIKIITFGFNSKATITISSIKENKVMIFIQRDIMIAKQKRIETQEKEIKLENNEKIYNKIVTFIIKELHN